MALASKLFTLFVKTPTARPDGRPFTASEKLSAEYAPRILRRRQLTDRISTALPALRFLSIAASLVWLILLPTNFLGQDTYIDENALQPGGVAAHYGGGDVHRADVFARIIREGFSGNWSSSDRAAWVENEFSQLGYNTGIQNYTYTLLPSASTPSLSGKVAYAHLAAPRSSASETILLHAPWSSLLGEDALQYAQESWNLAEDGHGGMANVRGVAMLLSLAGYLKKYSLWAKDLLFVISDGQSEGLSAFLAAYHAEVPPNLNTTRLSFLPKNNIWTSFSLSYPSDSFSHLGLFYEGPNAHLPNADMLSSLTHIARYTGGIPSAVRGVRPELRSDWALPGWVPPWAKEMINAREVKEYELAARTLAENIAFGAVGMASGVHGPSHLYRIDALTLHAIPAPGPHGFLTLGRTLESYLRTFNNLLERLHSSVFFYLLAGPYRLLKVGHYLPVAVLGGVAATLGGIQGWVERAKRSGGRALGSAVGAIVLGWAVWGGVWETLRRNGVEAALLPALSILALPLVLALLPRPIRPRQPPSLSPLILLSLGLSASLLSLLNFPFALALALLSLPFHLPPPSALPLRALAAAVYLALLSPAGWAAALRIWGGEAALERVVGAAVREWEVNGNWVVGAWVVGWGGVVWAQAVNVALG